MNGIDVCARDGCFDWAGAEAAGIAFALIRVSAGLVPDQRFSENIIAAERAGIAVGVYHELFADGRREALLFLSLIKPLRERVRLWAACRAEENRQMPEAEKFLRAVSAAGFAPMLAAPPAAVKTPSPYPVWLLSWGVTEARALTFSPTVWQYGTAGCANFSHARLNRGYFEI